MSEKKKTPNLDTFTRKGGSKQVWSTNRQISQALSGRSYRTKSRDRLSEQLANATDADELRRISMESKVNQGYADVINYYKSMYYYRYTVIPVRSKFEAKVNLPELTRDMLEIVETINFESILPHIFETGLFEGRATIYVEKHKEGLVTHVLPNSHSEPLLKSSYGTETVAFDLSYFDELLQQMIGQKDADILDTNRGKDKKSKRDEERAQMTMAILSYFPKELTDAYLLFAQLDKKGMKSKEDRGPQLIMLKPENAAIIPFSASSAPPKINVTAAEENYKEVLDVQNKKNKAGLEKIFTHKIPIGPDGDLLLTVDEAAVIQESMEQFLGKNAEVTVVTTIGDTDLHDVQREQSERNRAVSEAYDTQYESASINPQLFRANTDYALGVSLNRDAAFMWDILQRIMNFYNIVVNEMFNFGDYSCQINMLPITVYNEEERITEYRRNAEYGIGKLEAIIATGQKQVSLLDKLELEKELELDDLLTPLQSSHTRSSKDQDPKAKEEVKEDKDSKDDSKKKEDDTQEEDAEEVKNEKED